MSININPTGIFNNYEYSSNGTTNLSSTAEGVYIPLSDIHELQTNEANQAHGDSDYRKLLWGIIESTYTQIDSKDAADRPSNMNITRSAISFLDEDTAQRSYTITFKYSIAGFDVEAEP
jgi:hypothetical protein